MLSTIAQAEACAYRFIAMHPVIVHLWGPFSVYSYGLCMAAGITTAFLVFFLRARTSTRDHVKTLGLFMTAVMGGLIGSWLLFIISNWSYWAAQLQAYLSAEGKDASSAELAGLLKVGMVYYGGVLGGMGAGLVFFIVDYWLHGKRAKLRFLEALDRGAPALAIGHAWGRLGCFLAGCCYGAPCPESSLLCVRFPKESVAFADMTNRGLLWLAARETPSLVPVQLMEAGLEMTLAVLLTHLYSRRAGRGQVAGLYFIVYGIFRFVIEYYRFDPFRGDLLIFSTSQWISLLLIPVGAALLGSRKLRAVFGKA